MSTRDVSVVLFDIDGTLLSTDGAGRRALEEALLEVYGTAGPIEEHGFSGKTDPQIARELLGAAGVPAGEIESGTGRLWRCYCGRLETELARGRPRVHSGVLELLDRIEDDGMEVLPGLLTGNIEPGARYKLEAAGIGFDRFRVGAFGSDHADRDRLPAVAAERAAVCLGRRVPADRLVIVGDTPRDIACGKAHGARTVAVSTGNYSAGDLAAHGPDELLETLEDVEVVWRVLTTTS